MENKELEKRLDAALAGESISSEDVPACEAADSLFNDISDVPAEAAPEEAADADGSVPASEEYTEGDAEAPAIDEENADERAPERPYDVSDDGSPHGPLGLFSDDPDEERRMTEAEAEEKRALAYAAFHRPDERTEEEKAEDEKPAVPSVRNDFSDDALEDDEDEEEEFSEDEAPMTLMGHLNELRRRLFRIVIIVILGFVAFYGVAEPIYGYLSAPLKAQLPEGSKLIYTSPAGAFFTYLKVALVASLFGTSPFSFYQLWAFIAPGLYKEERRAVLPLAFFSSVFFIAGAAFCFFLVFPIAFKFFMGFATDTIVPMISVEEYLGFALKLLIAFGVVFEMPLFAYFLSRFGILSPDFMRRQRRYSILFIFIVAAILTPPDVFSQCLMALPMLLLYEVSIYVSAAAYKKKEDKTETEENAEETEKEEQA